MSPTDETEIKVLFYFSIMGIFIITSTKRMDKRSLQNDYFAASLSVSLTNPFKNILSIPLGGFPIRLKSYSSIRQFYSPVETDDLDLLNGLQICSKSARQTVSQTIRTLSRPFVIHTFFPFEQFSVSDSFGFHSHKC